MFIGFPSLLRGDDKQGYGGIHVVKCRARRPREQNVNYLERHVELYSALGTGKGQGSAVRRAHGAPVTKAQVFAGLVFILFSKGGAMAPSARGILLAVV